MHVVFSIIIILPTVTSGSSFRNSETLKTTVLTDAELSFLTKQRQNYEDLKAYMQSKNFKNGKGIYFSGSTTRRLALYLFNSTGEQTPSSQNE